MTQSISTYTLASFNLQCEKKGKLMSESFDGNGRSVGWKTWDLIRQPKQKWGTGFQKVQRI